MVIYTARVRSRNRENAHQRFARNTHRLPRRWIRGEPKNQSTKVCATIAQQFDFDDEEGEQTLQHHHVERWKIFCINKVRRRMKLLLLRGGLTNNGKRLRRAGRMHVDRHKKESFEMNFSRDEPHGSSKLFTSFKIIINHRLHDTTHKSSPKKTSQRYRKPSKSIYISSDNKQNQSAVHLFSSQPHRSSLSFPALTKDSFIIYAPSKQIDLLCEDYKYAPNGCVGVAAREASLAKLQYHLQLNSFANNREIVYFARKHLLHKYLSKRSFA